MCHYISARDGADDAGCDDGQDCLETALVADNPYQEKSGYQPSQHDQHDGFFGAQYQCYQWRRDDGVAKARYSLQKTR